MYVCSVTIFFNIMFLKFIHLEIYLCSNTIFINCSLEVSWYEIGKKKITSANIY